MVSFLIYKPLNNRCSYGKEEETFINKLGAVWLQGGSS